MNTTPQPPFTASNIFKFSSLQMFTLGFPDKLDRILERRREKWRKNTVPLREIAQVSWLGWLLCPCRLPWIQNSVWIDRSFIWLRLHVPETGQRHWGQTDTCETPPEHKRAISVEVVEQWSWTEGLWSLQLWRYWKADNSVLGNQS